MFAAVFDSNGRILCVRRDYGPRNWTTPGGRVEANESPIAALERETVEESGYVVRAKRLLGVYSAAFKDDLVLSIEAEMVSGESNVPNDEIAELGFFDRRDLPQPMSIRTIQRINDAFAGTTGVVRVYPDRDLDTYDVIGV